MLHSFLCFITDTHFGVLQGSFQLGSLSTFHHLVLPRSLTSLCLPGILCLKAFWMKLQERRVEGIILCLPPSLWGHLGLALFQMSLGLVLIQVLSHLSTFSTEGAKLPMVISLGSVPLPTPLWSVTPGAILSWMCHQLAGTQQSYISADL